MFALSLKARLSELNKDLEMYEVFMKRTEGTMPAERYVREQMYWTAYKAMGTLVRFYEDNKLFREFIESDDDSFMSRKFMYFVENGPMARTAGGHEVWDMLKIMGPFCRMEEALGFDENKLEYRENIRVYGKMSVNG